MMEERQEWERTNDWLKSDIGRKNLLVCVVINLILLGVLSGITMREMGMFSSEPQITTAIQAPENAPALRIVADGKFKPRSYQDTRGYPAGVDTEVVIEAANRLGMRPEITFYDWIAARNAVNTGQADVILGLEMFSNMRGVQKTIPVASDSINVYGRKPIADPASLAGKRVALMAQSVIIPMFHLNCEYVEYYTNTEILQALNDGEVDFAICHGSLTENIIKEQGLDIVKCFQLMNSYPTIGVRDDLPTLHDDLNRVLQDMANDGTIQRLENKWVKSSLNRISLTNVVANNRGFYLGYLAGWLIIAFLMILFLLQSRYYAKSMAYNERVEAQYRLLRSMADIYVSTHLIHLEENRFSELAAADFVRRYIDKTLGADEQMSRLMKNTIVPEMQDRAMAFTDLTTIAARMGDRKVLSAEFLGVHIGWIRAQFIAVGYDTKNRVVDVVFTTLAIEHEKQKEEYLSRIANSDALTNLYNRHAYETDLGELKKEMKDNFIVVSFDLNGLKYVNDTYGHKEGDVLLHCAGRIIDACFGKYGKVYRIGGDEFMALIYTDYTEMKRLKVDFQERLDAESPNLIGGISIACGYAAHAEHPALSIEELELRADKNMYQEKAEHYKNSKFDRRNR